MSELPTTLWTFSILDTRGFAALRTIQISTLESAKLDADAVLKSIVAPVGDWFVEHGEPGCIGYMERED